MRLEPSRTEIVALSALAIAGTAALICSTVGFRRAGWLDNESYVTLMRIIERGAPEPEIPQHFWGYPAASLIVAHLFRVHDYFIAVALTSAISAVWAVWVVYPTYGPWVTAFFGVGINCEWLRLSAQGGSEPTFVLLVYSAFLAARRKRFGVAALLASISGTVRPHGIILVLAMFVWLLWKNKNREAVATIAMGVLVATGYFAAIAIVTGHAGTSIAGYQSATGGRLISWPFAAIAPAFIGWLKQGRYGSFTLNLAWFTVWAATCFRVYWRKDWKPESLFLMAYFVSFLIYADPSPHLSRFAVPVVPIILDTWRTWLPRRRGALFIGAPAFILLAAGARTTLTTIYLGGGMRFIPLILGRH